MGFSRLQPPTDVVPAFQQVSTERQRRVTARLAAQKYANELLPQTEAKASALVADARSEALARTSHARGFADAFTARYESYRSTPRIYTVFSYLDRLQIALQPARKVVIAADAPSQTINLDLKSNVSPDLLDVPVPNPEEQN